MNVVATALPERWQHSTATQDLLISRWLDDGNCHCQDIWCKRRKRGEYAVNVLTCYWAAKPCTAAVIFAATAPVVCALPPWQLLLLSLMTILLLQVWVTLAGIISVTHSR